MKKLILFSIILLFFVSGCIETRDTVSVSRIIDGDTLELANGEKVRLLGIDAPEIIEPFYFEAKQELAFLVEKREVLLEQDIENTDDYDRLLRYVFVDNENVNVLLVRKGLAYTYILGDLKYKNELMLAEKYARENELGIWSSAY